MTDRLPLVLAFVVVAVALAVWTRRRTPDAPMQPVTHAAPVQLDRADFAAPDWPWLVVAFTSATCGTCTDVAAKVAVLESSEVATEIVEYSADAARHDRYAITGVPVVVIADAEGVVHRSFLGTVSATHLWAAVAEARDPGSTPPGCGEHD